MDSRKEETEAEIAVVRGTIRNGAIVGQDLVYFSFYHYYGEQHIDTEFEFEPLGNGRFLGRAKGFGCLDGQAGSYGSGAVYVKEKDILFT